MARVECGREDPRTPPRARHLPGLDSGPALSGGGSCHRDLALGPDEHRLHPWQALASQQRVSMGGGFKVGRMAGETSTDLHEAGQPVATEF